MIPSNTIKYTFAYLFSLVTVTTILVYVLDVPTIITNAPSLVKTYYYTNYASNFLLDVVLVAIYLGVSYYVNKSFGITEFWKQFGIVALITLCISGAFFLYFINTPKTSNFFSIWFHSVKYKALIYDIVLVSSVFAVKKFLMTKLS